MILLNALRGVRARVTMTKTGGWVADVDVDLDTVPIVPTGPAVLTVGTSILRGTIDDRASGRFGTKAKIRLVGGDGWNHPVPALSLDNDAGVLSSAVYAVTAASVGEPPVVEHVPPKLLGVHYSRMKGAASQVFAGVDWWVDILGITHVGPRIPLPAPPLADVLTWDPTTMVAEIASDLLIVPGMILVDPIRFGMVTVDDVEHTFDDSGRAIAFCSSPSLAGAGGALAASPPAAAGAKFVQGIAALARQACGVAELKTYSYRLIVQGVDGRLNLQATTLDGDAPMFLRLIDIWAGVPGLSVKIPPATVVRVQFLEGDRSRPQVVGFDPLAPPVLEWKVDAIRIVLGTLGTAPLAKAGGVATALGALQTQIAALGTALAALVSDPTHALPATVTAMGTLTTALSGGATEVGAAVATIPSTKAWTD